MRRTWTSALTVTLLATLGRAATADPATAPSTRPATVRVARVGDRITEGFTIAHPDHDGYPADLGRLLGDGYAVRNFGAGGCTLLRHGDRPYVSDSRQFYRKATAFDPDEVVIMLGTNDSKPENMAYADDFAADLTAMVDHFQQLTSHPRIYLCLPPPVFASTCGISDANVTQADPGSPRQVAEAQRATLSDVHAALAGDRKDFSDGIHPNVTGAAKIAGTVAEVVRQAK